MIGYDSRQMTKKKPRALAREEAILGWSAVVVLGALLTLLTIAALQLPPPPAPTTLPTWPPTGPTVTITTNGTVSSPQPANAPQGGDEDTAETDDADN